jgi:hypothetical protein
MKTHEQDTRAGLLAQTFQRSRRELLDHTRPGPRSGRYQALALTALEQSELWAAKAIATEEEP